MASWDSLPSMAQARAGGAGPAAAADWPSLGDEPCRYPDGRAPADRVPYGFSRGQVYPLVRGGGAAPWVLREAGATSLADWLRAVGGAALEERVAVLAVGSNVYPRQLLDKFRRSRVEDDSVITLGCRVNGAALAYAAQLSRAGYVPVSLQTAPGRETRSWIQYVTPAQLEAIAEGEGAAYALVECSAGGRAVVVEGLPRPRRAYGWMHRALLGRGAELGLELGLGPGGGVVGVVGVEQAVLLAALVRRVDVGAVWDGCRLPQGLRAGVRAAVRTAAVGNPIPAAWPVVDRAAAGFASGLVG